MADEPSIGKRLGLPGCTSHYLACRTPPAGKRSNELNKQNNSIQTAMYGIVVYLQVVNVGVSSVFNRYPIKKGKCPLFHHHLTSSHAAFNNPGTVKLLDSSGKAGGTQEKLMLHFHSIDYQLDNRC